MAKKEKTSFFGKIMGANITAEETEPQMVAVSQVQEEPEVILEQKLLTKEQFEKVIKELSK